jgi:DNA-nicking Smr family endonuclease
MERADNELRRLTGRLRRLSSEEARLWQRATADVQPIRGQVPAIPDEPAVQAKHAVPPAVATPRRPAPSSPVFSELAPGWAPGLDKRTVVRLRRGLVRPETQVDLHRCTQVEAHRLLETFLAASQAAGRRCVLVITGKGYGSQGDTGVLKTMVPRWLNEQPTRARVIAFSYAIPAHGGEGALYVLLRRVRRDSTE